MSRMRLLTVSGRTPDKAAMAVWGRARRWCRMVARRRSARVRTGRPTPGAISRGRWPRRLSRLVSRCWSCGVISAAIRASRCWAGRPVSTGWQSQARSGLGRSNGPGRELLEELQNERIERNLAARLHNRRGRTMRDPEEGREAGTCAGGPVPRKPAPSPTAGPGPRSCCGPWPPCTTQTPARRRPGPNDSARDSGK